MPVMPTSLESGHNPTVRIAFIGQCHTAGYAGVPADAAFPQVCRAAVQARRPGVHVDIALQEYQHPAQLDGAVTAALAGRPRVVVIEVVGWLTVKGTEAVDLSRLPPGIRSVYQRVRHFRSVAHSVRKLPRSLLVVQSKAYDVATSILGATAPRHLRTSPDEYEASLHRAVMMVRETGGVDCVIQGPGAPNLALDSPRLPVNVLERYRAVERLARRVADTHQVLYVDRWDTVAPGFFGAGSIRLTVAGHSTWGHLLADRLIDAGLV